MARYLLRLTARSVLCAALVAVAVGVSQAGVAYSGSLTTFTEPGGLDAVGSWRSFVGPAILGWNASLLDNGLWRYVYGFGAPVTDGTQFIVELPGSFTAADLENVEGSYSGYFVGTLSPGPDYPSLPGSIYGVNFTLVEAKSTVIAFDAPIEPDFGNFYAQGANLEAAYNDGFLIPNTHHEPQNGTIDSKILVPDTTAAPIPDASTIVLACFGALQLLAIRNKVFR
jgi:hypothetical protein